MRRAPIRAISSSSKSCSPASLPAPLSTTFNIGGVSFHPAPTGVRVAYAEGYAAFFIAAPDPQLSVITLFGDLLGFRQALFLRARAAVFPAEVAGTLPAAAVRTFVNVNLAAQDRVVFRHRGCLRAPSKRKMSKSCAILAEAGCYVPNLFYL